MARATGQARPDHLHARATSKRGLKAVPEVPDPDLETLQPVHWWNLLKAGFTPIEYAGPHRDAATRVLGRPWRVLEKGSLRIPVFRKLRGAAELYPQHFIRMAAYCHVIEQSEGGHSPYGIILFGYGYTGCTVPNIAVHRHALREALEKARKLIIAVQTRNQPVEQPSSSTICSGCHHGLPELLVPGKSELETRDRKWPANTRKGTDGKAYHSPCGDRFDWVPPHEVAVLRGFR